MSRLPVFDLDGTLIDSDEALRAPFLRLGVRREDVTFGHVLEVECARLGISTDAYLEAYDVMQAQPYPGVVDLVERLESWAVASNKVGAVGRAELERLEWAPEVAVFTEDFGGPKRLDLVLERLGRDAGAIIFVGDTDHDRTCAVAAGVPFALAGWNPRATPADGDLVLRHPLDLLDLL